MEHFAPSPTHAGYLEKTIIRGNCTITILRPILEQEERTRRENHVKRLAQTALVDYLFNNNERNATP